MREKIWHQMIAARYKAIYLSYFNSYVRSAERWLEVLLALASSAAVAGWLFWTHVPWLWAAIIGSAQLMKVLKPHIPFLKESQQLAASYVFFQQQHHAYECLWESMEAANADPETTKIQYLDLKSRELDETERTSHFRVPECHLLVRRTEQQWNEYLRTNHQIHQNS